MPHPLTSFKQITKDPARLYILKNKKKTKKKTRDAWKHKNK